MLSDLEKWQAFERLTRETVIWFLLDTTQSQTTNADFLSRNLLNVAATRHDHLATVCLAAIAHLEPDVNPDSALGKKPKQSWSEYSPADHEVVFTALCNCRETYAHHASLAETRRLDDQIQRLWACSDAALAALVCLGYRVPALVDHAVDTSPLAVMNMLTQVIRVLDKDL